MIRSAVLAEPELGHVPVERVNGRPPRVLRVQLVRRRRVLRVMHHVRIQGGPVRGSRVRREVPGAAEQRGGGGVDGGGERVRRLRRRRRRRARARAVPAVVTLPRRPRVGPRTSLGRTLVSAVPAAHAVHRVPGPRESAACVGESIGQSNVLPVKR
eukprot:31533-Pelagococcus_subviridis.AAC.5